MATIELNDDTVETAAMPAGSWVFGSKSAGAAAPTAFGREAIFNYVVSALAPIAASGSASDLTSGTVPSGRLHAHLAAISAILAPEAGDLIYFNGTSFTRLAAGGAAQVLQINESGIPEWSTVAYFDVADAVDAAEASAAAALASETAAASSETAAGSSATAAASSATSASGSATSATSSASSASTSASNASTSETNAASSASSASTSASNAATSASNAATAETNAETAQSAAEAAQAAAEAAQTAAETAETNAETAETNAETAQAAAEAARDAAIAASENPGFTLTFDGASQADSDPGAGKFRFNHATITSATAVYVDNADADGGDLTGYLDSMDNHGGSASRCVAVWKGITSPEVHVSALVTGSIVDGTGYRKITITDVAVSGTATDAEQFSFLYAPTGPAGSGLANIVEDVTPQLGGMLDVNGQAVGDGTLELLTFTETASAVNQVNVTNAATGNGPTLGAAGDDTNIDLNLAGKGAGVPKIGGSAVLTADAIGSSVQAYDADLDSWAGETPVDYALLADLASTANGDGASLIGIEDSGGLITATTVEGALAEIAADVAGTGGVAPNLMINGDFQINQRGYAGAGVGAGAYGHDRWKGGAAGASYTISGFTVSLTAGQLVQVLESAMWGVADFASTEFTVSVDSPSADLTVTIGSTSGTITAGSGRKSVTLTTAGGDTGNLSLRVEKATAGTVTFGRVKLELGSTATDWQERARADELRMCQRYYCKGFPESVTPANDAAFGSDGRVYSSFFFASTAGAAQRIQFPVPMRVTPTLIFYSPNYAIYGTPGTPGFWSYFDGSGWVSSTGTTAGGADHEGFYPGFNGSGLTPGYGTFCKGGFDADAEL